MENITRLQQERNQIEKRIQQENIMVNVLMGELVRCYGLPFCRRMAREQFEMQMEHWSEWTIETKLDFIECILTYLPKIKNPAA